MTWKDYEAYRVSCMLAHDDDPNVVVPPELLEVVFTELKRVRFYIKREELIYHVAVRTGIDTNSVSERISDALSKLKRQGRAETPVLGFWRAIV